MDIMIEYSYDKDMNNEQILRELSEAARHKAANAIHQFHLARLDYVHGATATLAAHDEARHAATAAVGLYLLDLADLIGPDRADDAATLRAMAAQLHNSRTITPQTLATHGDLAARLVGVS